MTQIPFLHHVFPPEGFLPGDHEKITAAFRRVTFSRHNFLLMPGTVEQHYWFVESGFIRAFATDPAGNDISTQFFTTGDVVIDWPSFFLRQPTREAIQAISDCVCWQLDFEGFQELFHSIEAFREAGRTRLVGSYFELKRHSVSMIVDQAKDRYKRLLAEKSQILQHVPLKQIATYLGITDTSLSRIRKEIAGE